jgi:hypothetical protein
MEGTLDESLVDSFIDFIKQNPDLKEELALFESISVAPENISFSKKESLYKEKYDAESEFDKAAIACLEDDITEQEKYEFENYLNQHPEKIKEALLFQKTLLKADTKIVFNKKNSLYKKSAGKTLLMWSMRVAAILLVALVLFIALDKNGEEIPLENKLAAIDSTHKTIKETPASKDTEEGVEISNQKPIEIKKAEIRAPSQNIVPEKPIQKNTLETLEPLPAEQLLASRESVAVPAKLNSLTASFNAERVSPEMAIMFLYYPEIEDEQEKLIGEKVKEKLNLGKISKAGLNLMTSISNERFTYKTTTSGKVSNYSYDSRLLAFSINGKTE